VQYIVTGGVRRLHRGRHKEVGHNGLLNPLERSNSSSGGSTQLKTPRDQNFEGSRNSQKC